MNKELLNKANNLMHDIETKVNDSDEQTTMDGKNMPDMSDQPQATPFANA